MPIDFGRLARVRIERLNSRSLGDCLIATIPSFYGK